MCGWIAKKFPYKTRADFANMTADEAQAIMRRLFECEFPFTGEKALQFALFRYAHSLGVVMVAATTDAWVQNLRYPYH